MSSNESTNIPMLMEWPVINFGLENYFGYLIFISLKVSSDLLVLGQIRESCNKCRTISNGDLQTNASGSRIVWGKIICEPVCE